MIVVDIGCADHGVDSIRYLIDRFRPSTLYGFDPWPGTEERNYEDAGTHVEVRRLAAWVHDGDVAYTTAGTGSCVGRGQDDVTCFDFISWLSALDGEVVVKIDAEGAEYPLLEQLIATGTDSRISLLLVEWHDGEHDLPERLTCPTEEWTL